VSVSNNCTALKKINKKIKGGRRQRGPVRLKYSVIQPQNELATSLDMILDARTKGMPNTTKFLACHAYELFDRA